MGDGSCRVSRRGPRGLAAFAGLDHHVGQLLNFGGTAHVVEDSEGLQILRNAAGGCGRFGVQGVVQAQQLRKTEQGKGQQPVLQVGLMDECAVSSPSCGPYRRCVGMGRDRSKS